ncbi:hypothetical protein OGAPHI_003661 [Ogataea philodendri]|uniref:Glutaminase n=1 Tax=Ogataea philodendri TaxID=1378263 RepID=A0A9P8T481_9ASCO|nr:uncharacterized protein OGAPHI_003661 [Ogataea philodendri]KAH3665476.1 hypothetical protein OGAPHI_003661 [Ogataea philodendri]
MTHQSPQRHVVVGVLSLQGSFREHLGHLDELFVQLNSAPEYSKYRFSSRKVREPKDLDGLAGIILVGGESTTISLLLQQTKLLEPLARLIQSGTIGVWGTCAGLILIANHVTNTKVQLGDRKYELIGGLDVSIERNSFGRQVDSFDQELSFPAAGIGSFKCVFIRAPTVTDVIGKTPVVGSNSSVVAKVYTKNEAPVEVISRVERSGKSMVVGVRQGHILGSSFHPELVPDYRFHKWFIDEFVL